MTKSRVILDTETGRLEEDTEYPKLRELTLYVAKLMLAEVRLEKAETTYEKERAKEKKLIELIGEVEGV